MRLAQRLLVLTFIESFATVCVERGVFFFAHRHLGFSDTANLWLSLSFGVTYVLGALGSHPLAARLGEKRALLFALLGQLAVHLLLCRYATGRAWLYALNAAVGVFYGLKWPIIESYVSAGQGAQASAGTIGRFNLSWSVAVPLALAFTGPANAYSRVGLFLAPTIINFAAIGLARPLPAVPPHLPAAHPARPGEAERRRMARLLTASRWLLLLSYACMWVISALIPTVLSRLAVPAAWAPGASGLLDAARFAAFVVLAASHAWIGRAGLLVALGLLVPGGFFLVLLGGSLAAVLGGEMLFGLAAGGVYVSALYYAMVVKNASVDAGGAHEALIGSGFALGPLVGLLALWMTPLLGSRLLGTLLGVGPLVLICLAGAGVALVKARAERARGG
jgi:hypothetical protein